ncbi:uncharacterized protein LOC123003769 isoform X2 [Tribolium madens]|nr:uncharacterized protein LOC123003769 isoform X2 [Tribolium madens]XP_044252690.1 uncharacterized protein LOC123003769 isoform X2 [Tribolium madens]
MDIEKFMLETENITNKPIKNITKGYESAEEIIKVLEHENKEGSLKMFICKNHCHESNEFHLPPKKRKIEEKKEHKEMKKRLKKNVKMCLIKCLKEIKYHETKKITRLRRRRPRVDFSPDECQNQATVTKAQLRNDSKTICVIKQENQEIVDLTTEKDSCFMKVNFALLKEIYNPEFNCEIIEPWEIATCGVSEPPRAHVYTHDVHTFANKTIDLSSDNEDNDFVISSAKECANKILPLVYRFHVNLSMENLLHNMQSREDDEDYDKVTFKFLAKMASIVGHKLAKILSQIHVKNLDFERFLEILVWKLGEKYQKSVDTKKVLLYLHLMLSQNEDCCTGGAALKLLKQISNYQNVGCEEFEVVFTKEQLNELQWQIVKYHEIVARQEELLGFLVDEECNSSQKLSDISVIDLSD